jgi:diguanylate cyclase (GGDEF)-like protein
MQILVVDDSRLVREMVSAIIAAEGYTPYKGENAQRALEILNEVDIDLILMDVEMPDVNGFQLTRKIREIKEEWVPIIFLTGQCDDSYLSQGIDAGGDDYLLKPVNSIVLSAKIRAMSRIAKMKADLDEANHNLLKLTNLDPLTEIVNRRGLDESLKRYWRMSLREKSVLSVIFLDIDHFKPYNDNYGHQQGDDCLRRFCKVVGQVLHRAQDMLARFGGEEFVILLPQTPQEGAQSICEDIIDALAKESIEHAYSKTKPYLTASLGVSTTADGATESEQLMEQADKALYQAKHSGRNKWVCYADVLSQEN